MYHQRSCHDSRLSIRVWPEVRGFMGVGGEMHYQSNIKTNNNRLFKTYPMVLKARSIYFQWLNCMWCTPSVWSLTTKKSMTRSRRFIGKKALKCVLWHFYLDRWVLANDKCRELPGCQKSIILVTRSICQPWPNHHLQPPRPLAVDMKMSFNLQSLKIIMSASLHKMFNWAWKFILIF